MQQEPNMKPRIALYRGRGFVSWLIQFQTRSVYSHAAMLVPGSPNRVIESREFRGVQHHALTENEMRNIDWFAIPSMTDEQYEEAYYQAKGQLGTPYDYWSVFRFVTKSPARENGRWFCSEFVFKFLADAGMRLLLRIPSAEVAPSHIPLSPWLIQVGPP